MGDESRRQFHDQLDEIRSDIVRLGAMAAEAVPRATRALLGNDLAAAQEVIDDDDVVDRQSLEIEESCLRLLALQQPMASDLRSLVTAVKLNWELERSADLAVNICKSSRRMHSVELTDEIRSVIERMSDEAYLLVRLAVDAYVGLDAALASALDDMDDRLDALQVELIRAILAAHQSDVLPLIVAVQLALVGRYYERIGDHAVNIGERVEYLVTGTLPG